MNKRKQIIFSLLGGVLLAGSVGMYLRVSQRRIESQYLLGPVLRAKKYIKRGKWLDPKWVEEVQIPVAYHQPTSLKKISDLLDADQKPRYQARIGILKNEQIGLSKLHGGEAYLSLSYAIPEGKEAYTLKLPLELAVGGHINPGDWVSLVCAIKDKAVMLFQRVQVLAVDENVMDPAEPLGEKNILKNMANDQILVTISLSPEEVVLAALAVQKGMVSLALTSPLDTQGWKPVGKEIRHLIPG